MLAIVSHDAGGAEILSSWLRQNPQPYCLVLDGPAIAIFQRKLGNIQSKTLEEALTLCNSVLCGTSWQSNLEKQAIAQAKLIEKKVVVFLDHWTNYKERFDLDGIEVLPDEIWVGDLDAKITAQKLFPNLKVVLVPNPYFHDISLELRVVNSPPKSPTQSNVLYVCEPIREHALLTYGDERYWGYTEEDALDYFLKNTTVLRTPIKAITIRPHPSELKNKYDWAMNMSSLITDSTFKKSLVEQIIESDIIVGCGSMAMVVGLLAKKRVISTIPPGGSKCELPQREIEHMQDLIAKFQGTFNGI